MFRSHRHDFYWERGVLDSVNRDDGMRLHTRQSPSVLSVSGLIDEGRFVFSESVLNRSVHAVRSSQARPVLFPLLFSAELPGL